MQKSLDIPPSPRNILCESSSNKWSSSTCQAENSTEQAHIGRHLWWWNNICNNGVDTATNTGGSSTLDRTSHNKGIAIRRDSCRLSVPRPVQYDQPGRLPQIKLPNSKTRIAVRNDHLIGRCVYTFPQQETKAAKVRKKAEPYQPT